MCSSVECRVWRASHHLRNSVSLTVWPRLKLLIQTHRCKTSVLKQHRFKGSTNSEWSGTFMTLLSALVLCFVDMTSETLNNMGWKERI